MPPLPQDEVLAHLLFGSGVGKLGALEVAQIAAGLATLTGAGGGIGDPLDKVRQGLGLDRLAVRNGANGNPALEAGRYIAPGVYLGARQGSSGGSQASVQVDIAKGLKLEATAGAGGRLRHRVGRSLEWHQRRGDLPVRVLMQGLRFHVIKHRRAYVTAPPTETGCFGITFTVMAGSSDICSGRVTRGGSGSLLTRLPDCPEG